MVKERFKWLIVVIFGCILWSSQLTLAQENYSIDRAWGIGVFPPFTLSVRLWLSDATGLEGMFSMLPIVGMTYNDDTEIGMLVSASVGAGPLFRITDGDLLDTYAGFQAGVISIVLISPPDALNVSPIFLPGVGVITGLEVSPHSQIALSLETGLWIFYIGRIFMIPEGIPTLPFPGTFNLGVHYYF